MATNSAESKRMAKIYIYQAIPSLGLSTRTENSLSNAGVLGAVDLVRKAEFELLKIPGFGQKALSDTKMCLKRVGLRLGMTTDEVISLVRSGV